MEAIAAGIAFLGLFGLWVVLPKKTAEEVISLSAGG